MGFHLATSIVFDFNAFLHRAEADQGPRHTVYQVAERLGAQIHQPHKEGISLLDKLLSKLVGNPEHWALARNLINELSQEDTIYCSGEEIGIPLAMLAKLKSRHLKLVVHVMAPHRPRFRALVKLLDLGPLIKLFTVTDKQKANLIRSLVPNAQVFVVPEQTDASFFTPGPGKITTNRPLIASAGLEQRDYITLALATQEKALDTKICAYSPNASAQQRRNIPNPIPENMEIRYFDFVELRDLYRSADIVVISLLRNNYSAGLTVLMEAIACGKPVIMSENIGLTTDFVEKGLILGVKPEDPKNLGEAIDYLLANPEFSQEMAKRAHGYFLSHYTSEHYVSQVCHQLEQVNALDRPDASNFVNVDSITL